MQQILDMLMELAMVLMLQAWKIQSITLHRLLLSLSQPSFQQDFYASGPLKEVMDQMQ